MTLEEMLAKTGRRQEGFRFIIDNLDVMQPIIVETGCIRQADNWIGDGMSTLIWDALVQERGGAAVCSCDISLEAVAFARSQASRCAQISCVSSVPWLNLMPAESIDLLYLDSVDVDFSDHHEGALHALCELTAAWRALESGALVAVDDNIVENGEHRGKGAYVARYFQKLGITPIFQGYQWVWRMP